MLPVNDPEELCRELGARVRHLRLAQAWSQAELAERAGVALSTLKLFERTGKISLARLVMLAGALRALDGFDQLLAPPRATSLAEIEARGQHRVRGRRRTP